MSLFTIVLDRNDLLLPLSAGTVLVIVCSLLLFVLFVHCVCINIHPVIRIYGCRNKLYAHRSPKESVVGGSAAQTVDGNFRVRSPRFRSSASP